MGEFNSDDHNIYYCGQESLRSKGVALIVNKRVGNALLLLLSHFSCVWLFATPWTVAHQAPASMGFSRQEYWSGLPFPSPLKCTAWTQSPNCRMILVHFQGKSFYSKVIQVYVPTTNPKEVEVEWFYEGLWDLLKLTPECCPFHHRGLECKSRKPRDVWNNRQVWPWSTKWSRTKANRVLPREHSSHSKHLFQ